MTIAVGPSQQLSGGSTGITVDSQNPALCSIDSTRALMIYNDGVSPAGDAKAVVLSISGSTITPNTPVTFFPNNRFALGGSNVTILAKLDATHYLVVFYDGTFANNVTAVVLTVAGTVVTAGTPNTLAALHPYTDAIQLRMAILSPTEGLLVAAYDSSLLPPPAVYPVNIAGTVVTLGAPGSFPAGTWSECAPQCDAINSTQALVTGINPTAGDTDMIAAVATLSGGVVTIGPLATLHQSASNQLLASDGVMLDPTHGLVVFGDYQYVPTPVLQVVPVTVAGTTVTFGAPASTGSAFNTFDCQLAAMWAVMSPSEAVLFYGGPEHDPPPFRNLLARVSAGGVVSDVDTMVGGLDLAFDDSFGNWALDPTTGICVWDGTDFDPDHAGLAGAVYTTSAAEAASPLWYAGRRR